MSTECLKGYFIFSRGFLGCVLSTTRRVGRSLITLQPSQPLSSILYLSKTRILVLPVGEEFLVMLFRLLNYSKFIFFSKALNLGSERMLSFNGQ